MKDITINIINLLPDDIVKFIINEYIKPDLILTELKEILNSEKSKKLEYTNLCQYLKSDIIPNNIVTQNLVKNDWIFNKIYDKHIIKNEKTFVLFTEPIESMALTWLMYLYH